MHLYKCEMDDKGVDDILEGFGEVPQNWPTHEQWFLVCHGISALADLERRTGWRRDDPTALAAGRVLVVSTDPMKKRIAAKYGPWHEAGRIAGLSWGLGTALAPAQQAAWKRALLGRFIDVVRTHVTWAAAGEPPWDLLEPPSAPENMLACYLFVSVMPNELPSEWMRAAEYEYRTSPGAKGWPPLEFSKDGLWRVLKAAGAVGEHAVEGK